MDRDNLDFICPVCSDTAVSAETVEVTTISRTSLTDSPDMAIPSTTLLQPLMFQWVYHHFL